MKVKMALSDYHVGLDVFEDLPVRPVVGDYIRLSKKNAKKFLMIYLETYGEKPVEHKLWEVKYVELGEGEIKVSLKMVR